MASLRTPQGHFFAIPPRRVTVGEAAGCDIPIARGLGVAAMHFHLQPWESGHFLEDAGSGLGTIVNGKAVTWVPLNHGDVILAGNLSLIYEAGDRASLPAFPSTHEIAVEAMLAPEGQGGFSAPAPEPEKPPAWLPPEALLPPVTPVQMAASMPPPAPRRRSALRQWLILLLLAAAVAFGLWIYYSRS